ncbi:unnamed protein product, partial [Callosobruchus maculatus]
FEVPDVSKCAVRGLKGCKYNDLLRNTLEVEEDEEVFITGHTDRKYDDVERDLYITNVMDEGLFKITQDLNMPDFSLWNPWSDEAKRLDNLDEDEYKFFIMAESGNVHVTRVEPQTSWKGCQIIEYISTKYQEECNFNFFDLFKGYC